MTEQPNTTTGPIALYGVGAMGEAVLAGMLASGRDAGDVLVVEASEQRAREVQEKHGVRTVEIAEAARQAAVHVVIVKPHDVAALLDTISGDLREGALVLSLAAGQGTAALEAHLPAGTAVVRGMPNTPALVGQGMTALSPGSACSDEQLALAEELMRSCGKVVRIPERLQDTATAVSGSGPAYVFHVAEAMIEGGVLLGMPRATAHELAVQTLLGAATMLAETGEHPSILRERVTSPGGTTAQALRTLDERGVRAAMMAAMEACARRSAELAQG